MSKLLIIEDDPVIGSIYRAKFCQEGHEVELAADGEVGVELAARFQPDAIILDLVLPTMTGVEVIRRVRAMPDLGQVPIIVFSNTYLSRIIQEAVQAGATKCLSKTNCTPREVIEVVRKALNPSGAATPSPAGKPSAGGPPGPPPNRPVPPPPGAAPRSEGEFQDEVRSAFLKTLPEAAATLRNALQSAIRTESQVLRLKHLQELYHQIHAVASSAGAAGVIPVAQMGDAVEALLKELHEKPKNINPSTLRTVASAVDFLSALFQRTTMTEQVKTSGSQILVVDDEALSRRAISHALEKANLRSINVNDPQVACKLLEENQFDLVFLDVDMPGMTGFELCTKLRAMPSNKKTPVIFVTGLNDFESRANSTISGGNDLIGKPFLLIELAVKALVYVMRGNLAKNLGAPKATTTPAPEAALPRR